MGWERNLLVAVFLAELDVGEHDFELLARLYLTIECVLECLQRRRTYCCQRYLVDPGCIDRRILQTSEAILGC